MINTANRIKIAEITRDLKKGLEDSDIKEFDIHFSHDRKIIITIFCDEGKLGFRNRIGILWEGIRDAVEIFKEEFIY